MNNNFDNMDDLFNQLMGRMGGFNSENRRYLINGREVTPEEFAQYRATGNFRNRQWRLKIHKCKGKRLLQNKMAF